MLRLTDVGDVGRVSVNGTVCGTTWTAPFDCDVTDALRPGVNRIDIEVAGTWMNRLIAEARQPTGRSSRRSPRSTNRMPSSGRPGSPVR